MSDQVTVYDLPEEMYLPTEISAMAEIIPMCEEKYVN
jgi:hypothetical protein